ncbi:hypothetical protein RGQ29_020039 [Quercus rubra]|uniref:MADS-box domain-containing protein n=1 Tax=Quercus rubra TaxID=3512 RepID=A0AAN7FFE5_QUERU|nr:hypothetical protein RGQ29_020039 [Quercus rubra]
MGRRKIEMKMVKDNSSRQVTFSKRRTGLFKKANELATLCGAEVAIVVFSPGGKPFSFGHPTVDSVSDRFLNQDQEVPNVKARAGSSKNAKVDRLNQQLVDVMKRLQAEKKKAQSLDLKAKKAKAPQNCQTQIGELSLHELEKLKGSLEELRENVKARACEMEASFSLLLLAQKPIQEADMSVTKKAN